MGTTMNITQKVERRIDQWPDSKVFRLEDFEDYKNNPKAVSEALSRQVNKEAIVRFSKGRFYKPKTTRYGQIRPGQDAFVEAFIYKSGNKRRERVAYMTGASLFYLWGLTTQVPSQVMLASTEGSFEQNIKGIRIKAKKACVDKLNENRAVILQILDVMKDFKTIPDAKPDNVFRVLKNCVSNILDDMTKIREAERLAIKYYRPSVQALLGAVMENTLNYKSIKLEDNLSPLSKYKVGVNAETLNNAENWQLQ